HLMANPSRKLRAMTGNQSGILPQQTISSGQHLSNYFLTINLRQNRRVESRGLSRKHRNPGSIKLCWNWSKKHGRDPVKMKMENQHFIAQEFVQDFDFMFQPPGQTGRYAPACFSAFLPAFAQEDCRGRVAIGEWLDAHGSKLQRQNYSQLPFGLNVIDYFDPFRRGTSA
ncbi:MAG TPA: hypothetical protein VLL97_03250, partial [Acidobacteriota bacterium]|nr:hypothetical protein [Acidobacteriota bacterium]